MAKDFVNAAEVRPRVLRWRLNAYMIIRKHRRKQKKRQYVLFSQTQSMGRALRERYCDHRVQERNQHTLTLFSQ